VRTVALADLLAGVDAGAATITAPDVAPDFASYVAAGVAREPSKPYLTWYDDGTGERVELSYATFANWVWKTANYLRDGLDVQPGERVGVLLRSHWQTVAIWYGAWVAGAVVVPLHIESLVPQHVGVVFAQEDALPAVLAAKVSTGEVLGLALRPMAGRLTATPAGVTDYAIEVPAYGDRFSPATRVPLTSAALPGGTVADVLARAAAAAAYLDLHPADRLLCTTEIAEPDAFVATALAAFAAGAGIVLSPNADEARLPRRCADERVTVHVRAV
jgi:uncharacterized protein (TIGR03089 family)